MSEHPKFILICGPSGVGKTTLSKAIAEHFGMEYLSADDFYEKVNGDECIHTNKFAVWMELFKAIHECEEQGIDCLVDSNALSASGRDEFVNWFPDFSHHLIYVDADDSLRLKNNKQRKRQIPEEVMIQMRARAEPPVWRTMDKKWKSLVRIINDNNHYVVIQKEGEITYGSIEDWLS